MLVPVGSILVSLAFKGQQINALIIEKSVQPLAEKIAFHNRAELQVFGEVRKRVNQEQLSVLKYSSVEC